MHERVNVFLLDNGKEEQLNFMSELFIRASCSCLRLSVHHTVGDIKLDGQEKLFLLTLFSGCRGLRRVSIM